VAALLGGLAAWEQAGYPVVSKEAAVEPDRETVVETDQETAAVLGEPNAPVTIVDFSDFQCPFCRRHFEQTLPQIVKTYVETGQVRYVFKDFPLYAIHPQAQKAAEAAECAGEQGQYWLMHDRIFRGQDEWSQQTDPVPVLKGYAAELELDTGQFDACLDSSRFAAEVQADVAEGSTAGVDSTPTFFINGRPLIGALPFSEFQRVIEEELAR
jgi:protein-disulfide isomerase